jgi:hypothetical protein
MKTPYEIETDQESIVIRLPRRFAHDEGLVRFLDYLEMQDIRQRSELSEEDAAELAREVKRDAWKRVSHLFEGERAE